MTHSIGLRSLPTKIENPAGAGYLKTLLDDIELLLNTFCGEAWGYTDKNAPLINSKWTRSPNGNMKDPDLPGLFLWVSGVPVNARHSDGIHLQTDELTLMWIPPSVPDHIQDERQNFWTAINAALHFAVNESWFSVDASPSGWGQNLATKAGLWSLEIGEGLPTMVTIEGGGTSESFEAFRWRLMATQAVQADLSQSYTIAPSAQTTVFHTPKSEGEPVVNTAETEYPRP